MTYKGDKEELTVRSVINFVKNAFPETSLVRVGNQKENRRNEIQGLWCLRGEI